MSSVPNIARGPYFLHSIPCHAPGRDDSIHAFAGARHYDVFLAIRVTLIRFNLRCLRRWGSFFKTASEVQFVQLSSTRARLATLLHPKLLLMLPERLNEQIRQNAGVLRAYIDTSMNSAILLPKLEQKFKGVVTDLEKIRIPALFGTGPLGGRTMLRFFCAHTASVTPLAPPYVNPRCLMRSARDGFKISPSLRFAAGK